MDLVINGLTVHYVSIGEGFPILMLHGYKVDHRVMTGCMEPVFQETPGFRRVYIDLPGMGQTKRADWIKNADAMLDLILEFIERVMPGERLLVAGESYGGYLARGLVRKLGSRVAGLLLICPVIHPALEDRTLPERASWLRTVLCLSGSVRRRQRAPQSPLWCRPNRSGSGLRMKCCWGSPSPTPPT